MVTTTRELLLAAAGRSPGVPLAADGVQTGGAQGRLRSVSGMKTLHDKAQKPGDHAVSQLRALRGDSQQGGREPGVWL